MKNPSAFPTGLKGKCELLHSRYEAAHVPEYDSKEPGMTLRDYFAAAALQGMLAATPEAADYPSRIATSELAYLYADAMLKERERGE